MAPNTEREEPTVVDKQLDLGKLAREKGAYMVYPDYPPLVPFEHKDPGHLADPKKASLFDNATKIYDLTPHVGTVIQGLQLSTLTDQQKNDLALLAAERGVVFFEKQDINPYQVVEFGKYFGRLHLHNSVGHPPGLPELISIYYDIDLIPLGGDTIWWSGYEAYDRLSPAFQKFVDGLSAVHTGEHHQKLAKASGRPIRREFPPDTTHPVVRTHPVTGWKSLFVQPGFTKSIVGMSKHESDAVLKFLFNHIAGGYDFSVRYKWEEGSVGIWDNRCTLHCAIFDYFDQGRRHGYRVTPTAEKPFFDPNSKSRRQATKEALEAAQ
ncbi:hypothetical protein [Absidia glauca]|uniref:TauD/TfdA-like domain-containing protein n=1 Tax=Absidia glauca TaxID=4829 RepID=A0A163TH95_ABSGL|nr:hypothetical protein [Absidia glauca]